MSALRTISHYATFGFVDSNEEVSRKNTHFFFPHGMSEYDFKEIAVTVARRFKRLTVTVDQQFVYGTVCTQSGLNTWDFAFDFNDYGTLTGNYWTKYIDNYDSQIPHKYAKQLGTTIVDYLNGSSKADETGEEDKSASLPVFDGNAGTRLVLAQCTNCAANLEVDANKDIAICPCCGAQYIVEKAIKDYAASFGTCDFIVKGGELKAYKGSSKDVIVPDHITIIGSGAFRGQAISSVSIPDSVKEIRDNAFRDCKLLEKINIPPTLVEIGVDVFRNCQKLKKINIPPSVEKIGVYAFRDCLSLNEIAIPDSVEDIAPNAFWADKKLRIIWPEKWANRQSWKMQIAANTLCEETRIYVRKIDGAPVITLFYCGRDPNGNFFFCERRNFYEQFSKSKSISEQFGVSDVVNHNIQDLFNDLSILLERADISKDIIRTVEVPYDGWMPESRLDNRHGDKIKVLLVQMDNTGCYE